MELLSILEKEQVTVWEHLPLYLMQSSFNNFLFCLLTKLRQVTTKLIKLFRY